MNSQIQKYLAERLQHCPAEEGVLIPTPSPGGSSDGQPAAPYVPLAPGGVGVAPGASTPDMRLLWDTLRLLVKHGGVLRPVGGQVQGGRAAQVGGRAAGVVGAARGEGVLRGRGRGLHDE